MESRRSLRIGFDASRAATGQRTGVEGYSYHLLRALLRLDVPHTFVVYRNRPLPDDAIPPTSTVEVRHVPLARLWTQLRLPLASWRDDLDVLFVPAHVLPLAHRGRSVVTVHDLGHLDFRFAYPPLRWWYLHLGTLYSVRRATRVLADSAATAHDLVARFGVRREKIDVVPLGRDPRFQPLPREVVQPILERHGLADRPYLLAISTIQPRKNYPRLLDAFAQLGEAGRCQHRLAIVGKAGYGANAVFERAAALDLGDAVRFLGYVPDEDLPALINGATALVAPSLYEGFGLPALEAMACGTPVIASNAGALPEVVGDAGLLVDPRDVGAIRDAIGTVVGDAALRARLREAGLAAGAAFSWTRCARETLDALERAARG